MGIRESKVNAEFQCSAGVAGKRSEEVPNEKLGAYIACLSNMAHTGSAELTSAGTAAALPEIYVNDQPQSMRTNRRQSFHDLKRQLKDRLQRRLSTRINGGDSDEQEYKESLEQTEKQLELLESLDSQDDNQDWESMKEWLVWCLHTNLDEDAPMSLEGAMKGTELSPIDLQMISGASGKGKVKRIKYPLRRQLSMDQSRNSSRIMSANQVRLKQATHSLDSEGRDVSNQSSFDSVGTQGET